MALSMHSRIKGGALNRSLRAAPALARPRKPAGRLVVEAFKITLKTPKGEKVVECDADTYILDAAEEGGVDLPYSCRAGSCSTCCAKVESGTLDQSDQSFLDDEQMGAGYALICVSYPTSDLVLLTHQEDKIM